MSNKPETRVKPDISEEPITGEAQTKADLQRQNMLDVATASRPRIGVTPMQNTSGQGKTAILPFEIKGWNWGAFLLNWIWGIGNSVWIALIVFIPIPFVGLIMAFVLGAKGSEWAWQSKRWDSVEHFRRTQRTWRNWGIGVTIVSLILSTMFFIVGLLVASEGAYF